MVVSCRTSYSKAIMPPPSPSLISVWLAKTNRHSNRHLATVFVPLSPLKISAFYLISLSVLSPILIPSSLKTNSRPVIETDFLCLKEHHVTHFMRPH